jgi:hypothetical protein
MNQIQAALQTLLPANRKLTTGGWISFNAVCCTHRGDRPDSKKRGGVLFTTEGFTYHCFNCGFKAGWSPGKLLSGNTKLLFKWCGMGDTDISKLGLVTLKFKDNQPVAKKAITFTLEERPLPDGTMTVMEWINTAHLPDIGEDIGKVVEYIIGRGMDLEWYNWMWSPAPGYVDRVIIPFYQDGKIVGYTGRKITEGKPKYLTDSQNGYVFNLDRQTYDRSCVIVVEGQFDAIAIDGVAIMTNEPNETQCARINALGKPVIVVPDKDKPGAKLVKAALDNGWGVSLPPWEDHIKDAAKATEVYGRLYTLTTILHYQETNKIKIQLLQKKLEALTDE